jgi:1,4-alpha-glucan branching enzyme
LVWSAQHGYPGDFFYREFHRDRIDDLDESVVSRWLGGVSGRLPSGLKYWRVTGPHDRKAWYDPEAAAVKARDHARDFVGRLALEGKSQGIHFVPFDAELFGHWWFEGPQWLEHVFRLLAEDINGFQKINTVTSAVMSCGLTHDARPAASSWGEAGDYSFWINHETAWIYPHLMDAVNRFEYLLAKYKNTPPGSLEARALKQAARTLLLAECSDWPFLVRAGTASDLGADWLDVLLMRFNGLCLSLENGSIDEIFLAACERADPAFPDLDLAHFQS